MRVVAMLALALLLAGCTADRIKQVLNSLQAQPLSTMQFTDAHRMRV